MLSPAHESAVSELREHLDLLSKLGTRLELRPVVLHLAGAAVEALLDPDHPELSLFAAWAMHSRHGPVAEATVVRAIELTEKLPEPLQEALLVLLSARALPVSPAQQKRIEQCTDLDVLDQWLRDAASANSVDQVLKPAARSPRNAATKQARPSSRRRASRA